MEVVVRVLRVHGLVLGPVEDGVAHAQHRADACYLLGALRGSRRIGDQRQNASR
jgi:hypothetical protein